MIQRNLIRVLGEDPFLQKQQQLPLHLATRKMRLGIASLDLEMARTLDSCRNEVKGQDQMEMNFYSMIMT